MKKIYTNPDIGIKVFKTENIITVSGEKAGDIMADSYSRDTTITGGFKRIDASDMREVNITL